MFAAAQAHQRPRRLSGSDAYISLSSMGGDMAGRQSAFASRVTSEGPDTGRLSVFGGVSNPRGASFTSPLQSMGLLEQGQYAQQHGGGMPTAKPMRSDTRAAFTEKFLGLVEQAHRDIKDQVNASMKQLHNTLRDFQDGDLATKEAEDGLGVSRQPSRATEKTDGSKHGRTDSSKAESSKAKDRSRLVPAPRDPNSIIDLCADDDPVDQQVAPQPEEIQRKVSPPEDGISENKNESDFDGGGLDDESSSGLLPGEVPRGTQERMPSLPMSDAGILFEVLDVWRKNAKHMAAKMGTNIASELVPRSFSQDLSRVNKESDNINHGARLLMATGLWAKIVLDPQSRTRVMWETFSILLVLYDIIWLPLLLFDPPSTDFTETLSWICRLFWTADMPMTVITGYMTVEGLIDYRPRSIAKRYMKTWLSLDLLVVSVDWLELLFEEAQGGGFARIGRVGRIFRMARMVRLLRVLRLQIIFQQLLENFRSEWVKELTVLVKLLLVIIGTGHFFACIWYGIGAQEEIRYTWVKTTFSARHSLGYRYATSLHWSLSQFSGGLDFVEAENLSERFYCVIVWIFGFTLGAVMISALTSSWTHLNILANDKTQKVTTLRKYLTDNKIPFKLANRLQRNAQHTLIEMDKSRPETSVDLLQLVSTPLRMELHFELYYRILKNHPFFERCGVVCYRVTQKVCHFATTTMNVSEGDVVFNVGEIPPRPKMIFVQSGHLKYYDTTQLVRASAWENANEASGEIYSISPVPDASSTDPEDVEDPEDLEERPVEKGPSMNQRYTHLTPGHWLAEPFLWTHWMCRGLLIASADSQLVLVDAQTFQEILGSYYDDTFNPKVYATEFVKALNDSELVVSDITFGKEAQAMERFNHFMQEKIRKSKSTVAQSK